WGIRVPFANLLQPVMGADAIWLSFPVSALCAMVLSLAYYRWGRWRDARMLGADAGSDVVAIPAEVPAQPPAPVADPCPRPADDAPQDPGEAVPAHARGGSR